jgi:hypothetical protein
MYLNSRHLALRGGRYRNGLQNPECKKLHFAEGDFYFKLPADSG